MSRLPVSGIPGFLQVQSITQTPRGFLSDIGEIFAMFDERTQDSGNVSYGVRVDGQRFFVKTAGLLETSAVLSHLERVALLRNAVNVRRSCGHHLLPGLHGVIESPAGPMLVYEWVDGELLNASAAERERPSSTFSRFRKLPLEEILVALDELYELHVELASAGWIAVDFYDGCLMYDFAHSRLRVIDLDTYARGRFQNTMGRMFGSERFMAPEEFERGAMIDERTTVFTLARTAKVLLDEEALTGLSNPLTAVVGRALKPNPGRRFGSVAEFLGAWRLARLG